MTAPFPQSSGSSARRPVVPIIAAVVVGIILIVAIRSLSGGGHKDNGATGSSTGSSPAGDKGCTTINLVASSEKAALLQQVAAGYAKANHTVDGHCARVSVTTKASGGAEQALARGWTDDDGARPDVWSPAAKAWVVLLKGDLGKKDQADLSPDVTSMPSVATTPLTLAMPKPMATALGWPDKQPGWKDILDLAQNPKGWGAYGHPEWGAFRLGKTDPELSTSGLHATIGAYVAATGTSSDLTAAALADPKVVAFAKGVENSVVHYGDTTLTFLSNLQRADDAGKGLTYVSAVAVEEKSVWDYNQGNPTGDPKTLGQHAPPKVPLVAVYPKEGTLVSDSPYDVLTAPWVDGTKKAVAADFLTYLQAPEQQKAFLQAGFRDAHGGTAGGRIDPANGTLPDQPKVTLQPPSPTVLSLVEDSWRKERKRARVLVVLDVSGSMGDPVEAAGGQSKLDLAKAAAVRALGQLQDDDEVGLWAFTTGLGDGSATHLQLAPIAALGPQRNAITQAIQGLQPLNGTPLYRVTEDAERAVTTGFDPNRINAVVVLTDGRNEDPNGVTDVNVLLRQLGQRTETDTVRVFTVGYGADADQGVLKQIAQASQGAAYDASNPTSIDAVLTNVLSNF
ncbi:MAG TPA: substrate-binding and VWA domain-containing protein [Mycobacteriales bacterium]|nr:substrate-binding and VWA domain-containing protein [Mycobacteriales bacterium]